MCVFLAFSHIILSLLCCLWRQKKNLVRASCHRAVDWWYLHLQSSNEGNTSLLQHNSSQETIFIVKELRLQAGQTKGVKGRQLVRLFYSSHPVWFILSRAFYQSHRLGQGHEVVCAAHSCWSFSRMVHPHTRWPHLVDSSSWSSLSENQEISHIFASFKEN